MSKYYVYGFFNKQWGEFFYIGKGCGDRYKQIREGKRNQRVLSVWENYPCESVILVDNLSEEAACILEDKTKDFMISTGKPLIDYEKRGCALFQRQGIEKAKRDGKYKGKKSIEADSDIFKEQYDLYMRRKINKVEFAKNLKVSRPTLDKMIKEYKQISPGIVSHSAL